MIAALLVLAAVLGSLTLPTAPVIRAAAPSTFSSTAFSAAMPEAYPR